MGRRGKIREPRMHHKKPLAPKELIILAVPFTNTFGCGGQNVSSKPSNQKAWMFMGERRVLKHL